MGVQGAGKRPEKTLQSILSRTPLFGKSRPRAEDATVDIGALMRNKLVVGKSTGQPGERGSIPAASPAFEALNPVYSPDDSLQKAACKLASLKAAADMLKQSSAASTTRGQAGQPTSSVKPPTAAAAPPAATSRLAAASTAKLVVVERRAAPSPKAQASPSAVPARSSQLGTAPPGARTRKARAATPAAPAAVVVRQPEHSGQQVRGLQQEASGEEGGQKRQRRRSVHPGHDRFGEWFTGGDAELDETLQLYNQQPDQDQRAQRAQRRKSAFPALVKPAALEAGEAHAAPAAGSQQIRPSAQEEGRAEGQAPLRKAAGRRKTLAGGDVAAQVKAVTQELCAQLDGLIECEPTEEGNRRGEEEKGLREQLLESWEGRSYYERLQHLSQEKENEQQGQKEQQQPQKAAPPASAGKLRGKAGGRVTRSRSASPDPDDGVAPGPAEARPPAAAALLPSAAAAPPPPGERAVLEAERQLRAELAAAYEMLNAALGEKTRLEGQLKAARRELTAERAAKLAAQQEVELLEQANSALQEEVKARKAGQRVVIGAAERVVELEARCSSAEGHLQAILRAAGSAVADLRAAAAPPHGGEGGAKGSVKAPSTRQWR